MMSFFLKKNINKTTNLFFITIFIYRHMIRSFKYLINIPPNKKYTLKRLVRRQKNEFYKK
jgi:hypothetical protein